MEAVDVARPSRADMVAPLSMMTIAMMPTIFYVIGSTWPPAAKRLACSHGSQKVDDDRF